jgi:hypothetical protein
MEGEIGIGAADVPIEVDLPGHVVVLPPLPPQQIKPDPGAKSCRYRPYG